MEWNNAFALGIEQFDEHHRHLVKLLNATHDSITSGECHAKIALILDELIDYATYHFAAEEYWMGLYKYPGLSEHEAEHEHFCQKVTEFNNEFHAGNRDLALEILQFLNSWLTDHILKSDADYGRFAAKLMNG